MTIEESPVSLNRSPGPTYREILDADRVKPAAHFYEERPFHEGSGGIPTQRYTSREFHELEKKYMWRTTWQVACREEHIPEVGDTFVYEICDMSFLIVRSAPDEIRAFWNFCRHRGRQLMSRSTWTPVLRCPFHSFTWNLDGTLAYLPTEWDFPHVDRAATALLPADVGRWGGFVFINPTPGGESLEDYMGEMIEHTAPWHFETRFVEAHVAKIFNANWKIVEEAFMESFHVAATHPQQMVRLGDVNTQYDCYENFSRALHPSGVPSPLLKWAPTEQEMLDNMLDIREGEESIIVLPEGETLRSFAAIVGRDQLRPAIGDEAETVSDAELIDAMEYTILPNFHPWAAYQRAVYRFMPYGDDHERSVMEVMLISPYSGDRPKPAEKILLGPDESWTTPGVLGITGRILDQDSTNIAAVQRGLQASPPAELQLTLYQESRIRHFHKWLIDRIEAGRKRATNFA